MRVWIENPFDTLPTEGGRPQRYWLMAAAFAAAGHAVDYWTSDFSHIHKAPREIRTGPSDAVAPLFVPTRPYAKNVSLARIASHRAYAREWGRLAEERAASHGKPDVIIVSMPPLATGDVAVGLARKFGAKLVVDVMDAWPDTFYRLLPSGFKWLGRFLFASARRAARRQLAAADLVTGVAARYEDLARAAGAKAFRLAYHGVEMTPPVRREPSDRLRLVYVGSMGRTYGLEAGVAAVARLGNATLDLAGGGEKLESLKALASGLGCADRVRFHGYLGDAELQALLAACDIGVVPMSGDSCVGVPYKLGDYTRAGLAVASSLDGESLALLADSGAGLRYDPDGSGGFGLADVVLRLAKRLPEAQAASRRLAERTFDAAKIYAQYVRRVEELV